MQVLKEMKDRVEGDLCSPDELLQVIESYPKTLKNKVSKQMSTLAIQKLAPIEDELRMFRKSEGIRLLCYLLKDTTTSDMAEPFQEKYLESGLEYTKYRMQYIASLIIHAKEHFDDIDLSVHLQLIDLILR